MKSSSLISFRLSRKAIDFQSDLVFRPLTLPDLLAASVDLIDARFVEELRASAKINLTGGTHELPLSGNRPCIIEVDPDASAHIEFEACDEGDEIGAVVQAVRCRFDSPVRFRNIVSTLAEVQGLFQDKFLARAKDFLKLVLGRHEGFAGWLMQRGEEIYKSELLNSELITERLHGLESRLDNLVIIHLDGFEAAPKKRRDGWHLEFRFDGHVSLGERLNIPFWGIKLADFILPTIQASLDKLLTQGPLGSAQFMWDKVPHELSAVVAGLVDEFSVSFDASGYVPRLGAAVETVNLGHLAVELTCPWRLAAAGELTGKRKDQHLHLDFELPELHLGERSMGLKGSAEIEIDEVLELARGQVEKALRIELPSRNQPQARKQSALVHLELTEGSQVDNIQVALKQKNTLVLGQSDLSLTIADLEPGGSLDLSFDASEWIVSPIAAKLQVKAKVDLSEDSLFDDGLLRWKLGGTNSTISSAIDWKVGQDLELVTSLGLGLKLDTRGEIEAIPELNIDDGTLELSGEIAGQVELNLRVREKTGVHEFHFADTTASLELKRFCAELNDLSFELPNLSQLHFAVLDGHISTSGLGNIALSMAWDLAGASPILSRGNQHVEIFVDELRTMSVEARVSPSGRLSFTGGQQSGLYDSHFINALFNPMDEPEKWTEILQSESAWEKVAATIAVFSPRAEELGQFLREHALRIKKVFDDEAITQPKDIIPRQTMARVFSRIIAGNEELQDTLAAIIQGVTEGHGLDRREIEKIIAHYFPDHEYQFEVDRILRWLDHTLAPIVGITQPVSRSAMPLCEEVRFHETLRAFPKAHEIYQALQEGARCPAQKAQEIANLASYLSFEQVKYLASRHQDFPKRARSRINYVLALKRRIQLIQEGYGGLDYAPQPFAIAFFLGNVVANDRQEKSWIHDLPVSLFGPKDLAVLLQAGLATFGFHRTVQVNQRLLLEYLSERGRLYTLGVLVEMSGGSPRVLTGLLLALLNQPQVMMRKPLDIPALFSKILGVDIPRRSDYMAGGRWAKDSYFQALMRTAEYLLDEGQVYTALRQHIQQVRVKAPRPKKIDTESLVKRAQEAIAAADKKGAQCAFEPIEGPIVEAEAAYREAFGACAELLKEDRSAFYQPWFKRFWGRNHEALVVRSVLRNVQEDIDQVRSWLSVRTGCEDFSDEQALLKKVVDTLYYFEKDKLALLKDPLVRLLIDPKPGHYDFTIVSGMGVVTDGAQGRELETSFARLEEQRGVKIIRADTGTAKTFEYNAEKVEAAIRAATTPFGLLGYSQGCANVLAAESLLLGGTPEQQKALDGLRTRNLLFSALNGSAHGSGSNEKYLRAVVEGERFLKFYQAFFSQKAIALAHHMIGVVMDSQLFTHVLGSVNSLSWEGAAELARDGLFCANIPSSTVRGVVTKDILPEALEFLANIFEKQIGSPLHDTQVYIDEAVAHSVWVRNPNADKLLHSDMSSVAQNCHHWSPLVHATAFVTTPKDVKRAIYDFPKDRHVFPWLEVNARFGNIEVK